MFNSCNASGYSLSDIAAATNSNDGFGCGGNGAWWIIILFLFVFCGWGGNGFGNNRNDANGALTRGELCQDMNFSGLENATRGIQSGLCDGFYAMNTGMLNGFAGVQNGFANMQTNLCGEFRSLENGLCTLGYQTQQGINGINVNNMQNTNALQAQINDGNCKTQHAIHDAVTQSVMNTNAIQNNLQSCCCNLEKMNMQNRFDMQQYNCGTLQAIEKVGDRVIDYISQRDAQALRDENLALKFAASQCAQNTYLTNELKPCPVPAYIVQNPYCNCNANSNVGLYGC